MSGAPDPVDEALMQAYAAGEAAAFDQLYQRHRAAMFRYVRRHVGNEGLAQELFQDIWMRVINARQRYVVSAKFSTWLYTIAHNRVMDHFRATSAAGEVVPLLTDIDDDAPPLEIAAPDDATPQAMHARRHLAERILGALDALPREQREAFVLQQEADLSVEEIASVTGVNRETAKSRLRYALAKLRRDLQDLR
jgi:RNA polymerase sigma-70 factor (ECF subfamily)